MRKLPGNVKDALCEDTTQAWHSPHSPPAPLKPRVSGHVTLSANFLQDVAVCFSAEQALTTLSKRPLKWPASESDLHKV